MGFLSSLFRSSPAWNHTIRPELRLKDAKLLADLERFRLEREIGEQLFVHLLSLTRSMLALWVRVAFREAQKKLPGRPLTEYFGMVIGDKILKKMAALHNGDVNSFASPKSAEDLERIAGDLEGMATRCSTIDDVVVFLVNIETAEGQYNDPFGYIDAIDAICFNSNEP